MSSVNFVFFGPIGKTRWPHWPLIGWAILKFSAETADRNSTKLYRKQYLQVLYQPSLCFSGRSEKQEATLASDWLRHFEFSSATAERNSTKLDKKQDLNVLYQVYAFQTDREKKQDSRQSIWLAETFSTSPLKPLNEIQRNLTGSNILTSSFTFVFFGSIVFWTDRKKQDGHPGLWLAEIFSIFPLKPLNVIQRNLTWSKISTSSTKFVFFNPISKQKWPPWPIPHKGGTLYSGARYVALWTSCLQLLWNHWTEFKDTW